MRHSLLPSRSLLAALVSGAVVLAIPVVTPAAPSVPRQSVHLSRADNIQKTGYYWHHRYPHRRYAHRWFWHDRTGAGITAEPLDDPPPVRLYHT
jgi:hypothetical protein